MTGGTNPVATYTPPNNTTQDAATYKANLDGAAAVFQRVADQWAPHQSSPVAMTVTIDAGSLLSGTTLTEVAAQTSGTITAPATHPRIDRAVIDNSTGTLSIITGTENISPTPPALTSGKLPVAQILLQTTSTSITNSMITDERNFWGASIGTNSITNAMLAQAPAYTAKGNNTNSTANESDVAFGAMLSGGFLNTYRNGTFDIWRRGTAAMTVTTSGAYTADGWIVLPTGASVTAQQASNNRTGANTLYGLQVTGAASVTDVKIKQRIESYLAVKLAGKTVTEQRWVFNNTGGSITPQISTNYATAQDNFSSVTNDLAAVNMQPCPNGAWTLISYTFTASANAVNGYEVVIDFGNNFSTTGKSIIIAEADIRPTLGIATGLTSSPPPAELRNPAVESLLCQRYLPFYDMVSTGFAIFGGVSAGVGWAFIPFAVPARIAPTGITVLTSTIAFTTTAGSNTGTAVISAGNTTDTVGVLTSSGATLTSGNASLVAASSGSTRILWTGAEL